MALSPQGYVIEKDPLSEHPFWNNGSSELPTGLPGQVLEANESGEFVPSDSLIDLKSEVNNLKEELQTVHQDQGDIGDTVNEISGNVNHLKGGTTGQVLYKTGNADFAFGWKDEENISNSGLRLHTTGRISTNFTNLAFSNDDINVYIEFKELIFNDLSLGTQYIPITTNIEKRPKYSQGVSDQVIYFSCNKPAPDYDLLATHLYIYGLIEINDAGLITKINLYKLNLSTMEIEYSQYEASSAQFAHLSGLYYMEDINNV